MVININLLVLASYWLIYDTIFSNIFYIIIKMISNVIILFILISKLLIICK